MMRDLAARRHQPRSFNQKAGGEGEGGNTHIAPRAQPGIQPGGAVLHAPEDDRDQQREHRDRAPQHAVGDLQAGPPALQRRPARARVRQRVEGREGVVGGDAPPGDGAEVRERLCGGGLRG